MKALVPCVLAGRGLQGDEIARATSVCPTSSFSFALLDERIGVRRLIGSPSQVLITLPGRLENADK